MSSPNNLNAGMRCIKFIICVISLMFGVSLNRMPNKSPTHPRYLAFSHGRLSSHFLENGSIEQKLRLSDAIIKTHKTLIDN